MLVFFSIAIPFFFLELSSFWVCTDTLTREFSLYAKMYFVFIEHLKIGN